MPNTIPVPTESEEQQALFRWVNFMKSKYPELELLYHIPNEGKRSRSLGAKMKREGLKKGVPDICLPVKKGQYSSLYIELKRQKGASVSKEQKEMIALLTKYGSLAVVCYGWEDAAKVIERYLKI